jgi:hypothetical protein
MTINCTQHADIYNIYKEGRGRIPLTCLTPPHMRACPKSGPGFPTSYVVMSLFVFGEMRLEVIVRLVDIGWIVDHHCLNFLFVTDLYLKESMFYIEIWHLTCFNLKVNVLYIETSDKISTHWMRSVFNLVGDTTYNRSLYRVSILYIDIHMCNL